MDFHKCYKRVNKFWQQAEFNITRRYTIQSNVFGFSYDDERVRLTVDGKLTVKESFYFGASGPTIDTKSSRMGSCFHDALYYISQHHGFDSRVNGGIVIDTNIRLAADMLIKHLCIENDMWEWRANMWYKALRFGGEAAWLDKV
jgi:hypothetical protein